MIKLIKFVIWLAGLVVIAYFVLGHFGYEFNPDYLNYSKDQCEQKLRECSNQLIHNGIDNAQCDFVCVKPGLIIKKK